MSSSVFYVGSYTGTLPHVVGRSSGIHAYELNNGELSNVGSVPSDNPSFLTTDRRGTTLYVVNELLSYRGESQGAVSAFRIESDWSLSPIGQRGTRGEGPCHVTVDLEDKWVMVANYYGGSVAVFPRLHDGSLGEMVQFIQHQGATNVNPKRQDQAHAHLILTDPRNRFAYVPDLGLDQVVVYQLTDGIDQRVLRTTASHLVAEPGAGPRHLAFHPDGRHLIVINELNSTIVAAEVDPDDGSLKEVAVTSTLPPGYDGESTCAEIVISANGFIYGSNRGHDSIVTLAFDGQKLEPIGWTASGGRTPRHFALDPTETYIVVANQDSDTLAVLEIDPTNGVPIASDEVAKSPTPVYVCFPTHRPAGV